MTERLLVRDLIGPAVTCAPDLPLAEIARLLLAHHLEAVIVLNRDGHAVGVVSQDDVVTGYGRPDRDSLTAEDVMNERIPQVRPDLPLAAAAQIMRDLGVRALFVMPQRGGISYPAAMLSYRQLLRHLAARSDDELNDLGINVVRQPSPRPSATP